MKKYNAIDLFAGCGGMSEGIKQAGFSVVAAVEINKNAASVYKLNHLETNVFECDIRTLDSNKIRELLHGEPLHLLAGCPPCQGFSSVRCKNKREAVVDGRNNLIDEFLRLIVDLHPQCIMLENVPGIIKYERFLHFYDELIKIGYNISHLIVDFSKYGVPQRRKRLVLLGALGDALEIDTVERKKCTVREAIGKLEKTSNTKDDMHKMLPNHSNRIKKMISVIPKEGGSQKDLPEIYRLNCHKKSNIGFSDVYGRMKWDDVAPTITGGCLNPSKGRFLHPEEDRCISAREASLLQTFPYDYIFPTNIPKESIASMIGNALPPLFSQIQCTVIYNYLLTKGEGAYAR
ncbi:DNA cytosine methyltransferase [Methanorbis rubei]|uniref:DNA (cytosine-5-)-methyltransferase n=1 Tax=Methanorbis rubei TaxID=3028300 RepID=A0AAE4MIT4_9EURY|nr:putative BsuMI modification methylase subunit YdiO [Methanocorpusculaceae archaeon Cs1]